MTTLDDSGPASLRAALEAKGPRTVVFRVAGTIELKTPLRIREPSVTVAGQTAPRDGICLKNYELQIGQTHDVIVDHCSATWSTDECLSVTNDSDRVTVQHCLIAEALTMHGLGSIIGTYRGSVSFLHNLYAHNRDRNPRASGYQATAGHAEDPGPRIEFRGNTLFNWSFGAGYTGSGKPDAPERVAVNYVGNYLKAGADTSPAYRACAFAVYGGATADLFLEGNEVEKPVRPVVFQSELVVVRPGATVVMPDKPLEFEVVPKSAKLTTRAAHRRALEGVGASKPRRDTADIRIIAGGRDGSVRQVKTITGDAWPILRGTTAEADTDGWVAGSMGECAWVECGGGMDLAGGVDQRVVKCWNTEGTSMRLPGVTMCGCRGRGRLLKSLAMNSRLAWEQGIPDGGRYVHRNFESDSGA